MLCGLIGFTVLAIDGCGNRPPTKEVQTVKIEYIQPQLDWWRYAQVTLEEQDKQQQEAKNTQILYYIATLQEHRQPELRASSVQSSPIAMDESQQRFFEGYRSAGGNPEYEQRLLNHVIPCESGWQIDPGNPMYLGMGQFTPGTWESYSRFGADTDPFDSWEQGWAVANLIGDLEDRGVSSGSSSGWPVCWWS